MECSFIVLIHIKWMIKEVFLLEIPEGSRVLPQHLLCISKTDTVTGCCITRESLDDVDSMGTLFWEGGKAIWEEHGWPFWII